jgi:hypothetical protein
MPPNECRGCPPDSIDKTRACDGSFCLLDEYLRFTLVFNGRDCIDYGLKVTTPGPNVTSIGAYGTLSDKPNDITNDDRFGTGGFVDKDFHHGSGYSDGKWTKSIVFPLTNPITKAPIQKGTYRIQLEALDLCGFGLLYYDFELKVYQNHRLMNTFTTGQDFTFTLR